MNEVEYSVVVPVFNSSPLLNELFDRLSAVLGGTGKPYELIFVDDGSMDGSWEVLKGIKADHPGTVKAIKLSKNFGQHNATFCGFNFMTGNWLITIDDDLQNPPEEILRLITAQSEADADLVYGIYDKKQHSFVRNLGSKYVKKTSRILGRPGEGSAFRLISRDIVQKILMHHQNFVFIDELLSWYTDNICFVKVLHEKRKVHRSGYSTRKLWGLVSNLLIYYTTVPLKIMTYGGFISSAIFMVLSAIFAVKKIFFNVPLGYTSLIVAILFSTSLILFCLGIIGEYLSRLYLVQNKKPPYSIKKVI
jgi:undecaprenyl-phosphate 4-deoxy-4-formamido-L-arabinose transferase